MRKVPPLVPRLVAAGCLLLAAADKPSSLLAPRPVKPTTFRLVQRELGVIEAGKSATVYNQVSGEIIWIAAEGSHVNEGDPVVKLANRVVEEEAEDYARRYEDHLLRTRRAELDYELKKRENTYDLKRKQLEVRQAEWELRDLEQRASQRQMRMLELDAITARYQMEYARLELEALKALRGTTLEASEELKEKKTAFDKAVVEHERAVALLQAAREGPNRRRIEVAQKRVEKAKQSLELQRQSNRQEERVAAANVEMEKASLSRSAHLAKRNARREEQLVVRASMAGTVRLMGVWKGEGEEQSPIRVGESRSTNMDLLRIADLSTLLVRLHVSEADVSKIAVGQPAAIRLVAFPDKVYRGQVHELAPFAEDKNIKLGHLAMARMGVAGVHVVDVLVRVIDQDPGLHLGLTARVDIRIAEEADVLTLPHTAVAFDTDQAYCYVCRGGRPHKRSITLGLANEDTVVVSKGLEPGEPVYPQAKAVEAAAP